MDITIRKILKHEYSHEYSLLYNFLYEAIFALECIVPTQNHYNIFRITSLY